MAEGYLAGKADEDIKAYGGYRGNPYEVDEVEPIGLACKGNDHKEEEKSDDEPQPAEIRLKNGKFFFVSLLEIPTRMERQSSHAFNPFAFYPLSSPSRPI